MNRSYSQRNAPPPSRLLYDLPDGARTQIVRILEHYIRNDRLFFRELESLLCRRCGELRAPGYEMGRRSDIPAVEHFLRCTTEEALDFIEACFQLSAQCGGQKAVDEINRVFRQHGIGYELTRFLGRATPRGSHIVGGQIPVESLPRVVRIDAQAAHVEMVAPALALLTNPIFAVANAEMLKAFSDHRAGRHEDAITACGSAFESVLKTICDQKGWEYDRDKDTCARLVDICCKNKLFPSLYVDLFKRVGTIRNKLGDAHGRGPVSKHDVKSSHAEHMLHMTCSHIILLCRLSGFE